MGFSNPIKNHVLESYSNIFFPLIEVIYGIFSVYFDASDDCNSLDFQLGNVARGITSIATRSWAIKVSQYSCSYDNLALSGCTQYFNGLEASNILRSFNFA